MAKLKVFHRCSDCGATAPRWAGRCGTCGAWNTLVEEIEHDRVPVAGGLRRLGPSKPQPIAEIDVTACSARPTGIGELDRVLGGGLVPGSVTLAGGEPGIGKSTLLLQAMASMARHGGRGLVVSAEESTQQVRMRADRLDALAPSLWLLAETSLPAIVDAVEEVAPDVLVVDSIQTVADPDTGSAPGSVTQVRACAAALVAMAKERELATVLVGHVTKDGDLAGPRVLEHIVDTVLSFEGERHHALRLLRAVKHRFGATGELGLFEMTDRGLRGVPDPSGLFLGDRRVGIPGSVVTTTMEGQRPLLVELQALLGPERDALPHPRRSAQGLDGGRLALLLAVLDSRCGIRTSGRDVYVSAVGGVRVVEPGADLALALAIASYLADAPLPPDVVACGEIGLGGELRQVGAMGRRLGEASRLGFTTAVVPASAPDVAGMKLVRVPTLTAAVRAAGLAQK